MAPKVRRRLVVDPPPSPQQEEEKHDDESKQEKDKSVQPKSHKIPDKKMNPQAESSSESGDSDSPESPKASDFTVKPSAKPTKRKPQTNAHNANAKPSKLNKLKHNDESRVSVKSRLWSEQDEIAILKGLIEFQNKTGKHPSASANQLEFYNFVKKSLHVDVSRIQLTGKVKRLKAKFNNNLSESVNADDPLILNPHECKSFQLSKQIWGNNVNPVDDDNDANNASNYETKSSLRSAKKKSSRGDDKLVLPTKDVIKLKDDKNVKLVTHDVTKEVIKVKDDKIRVEPVQEKEEGFAKLYPFLMNGISSGYMSDTSALSGFVSNKVNKNLNLVCGPELKELDGEWKELKLMETQLFLRKLHLIQKQTKMLLDTIKSFS